MTRNGISEKVANVISGRKTRSVFDRYNVTSYDDLVKAGERFVTGGNGPSSMRKSLTAEQPQRAKKSVLMTKPIP